jgi:low temperature requirement protein LtrA
MTKRKRLGAMLTIFSSLFLFKILPKDPNQGFSPFVIILTILLVASSSFGIYLLYREEQKQKGWFIVILVVALTPFSST